MGVTTTECTLGKAVALNWLSIFRNEARPPELRHCKRHAKASFYDVDISSCSLGVLFCCPAHLAPTLASWLTESAGPGPDRVLTNQTGLSGTVPYLHVLIALTISTNPTQKSTAKFLRHWHLLERLAAPPHTPSTTTSRHRTEPRPFSPTDKSIPSPITQNGQDLVSANPILAEVDPWTPIQAVAGRANCGQSGDTQNRRRTEENNKNCTT